MEKLKEILNHISLVLSSQGFKLTKIKENGYSIYDYRIKNIHSINNITFLEKENIVSGFYYGINFIEMECITIPILTKNKLFGDVKPENIDDSFFGQKETKYTLLDKGMEVSKYFEIIKIFDLFFSNDALPFFEKWKDLSVLYEYIKDKTEEELWDILGQFAPMKKATILRLCNDSNYQEFMDNYYQKQKEYFEQDPEDIDNIRYYNASKELKEVLDKTKPITSLNQIKWIFNGSKNPANFKQNMEKNFLKVDISQK